MKKLKFENLMLQSLQIKEPNPDEEPHLELDPKHSIRVLGIHPCFVPFSAHPSFFCCTLSVAVCQSCSDLRRKRTSTETDDVEATHRSVEEIISRISDPNLDCSLEDIEVV